MVRAGLLPRVRAGEVTGSDTWFVTTMLPGAAPFDALAESLRRIAVAGTTGLADVSPPIRAPSIVSSATSSPWVVSCSSSSTSSRRSSTSASERDQRVLLAGLVHTMSVPDSRLRVVALLGR